MVSKLSIRSDKQGQTVQFAKLFWNSGATLIASAAFIFSCTGLAVKLLHGEIPTFQVVLVPGIICFLSNSLVVRFSGLSVRSSSWRIAGLTLLRGLLGATSITCFYLAIELLPLQDAVTLFFCSPVLAALLELLVIGESTGWAGAAATACTVTGVVLVAQPPCVFLPGHAHHMPGGSGTSALGVILSTCAALANAAAFVVVRLIGRSQKTAVLTWWYHAVVVVVAAVPLILRYPAPAMLPSRRGCALLAAVGATQFLGQLLLNRGFQLETATRGSAINVLQVPFSFVWDVAVLGDTPGWVSVVGSSLVAAGVLCVALTGRPTPRVPGRDRVATARDVEGNGGFEVARLLDPEEGTACPALIAAGQGLVVPVGVDVTGVAVWAPSGRQEERQWGSEDGSGSGGSVAGLGEEVLAATAAGEGEGGLRRPLLVSRALGSLAGT